MIANIDSIPRVFLVATKETTTSVVDIDTKPERRCNLTLESQNGGSEILIANNVPWAQAHYLKQTIEGVLELALALQADLPTP